MESLYDKYQKLSLDDNIENNAYLIYVLASLEKFNRHGGFMCSIENGDSMNQIWLHKKIENKGTALLEAKQSKDGSISLSIQGLSNIDPSIKNYIDFFDEYENKIFMEFLKYF